MSKTKAEGPVTTAPAPPLERLFLMWLRAADLSPRAFLRRLKVPEKPFLSATVGWIEKRQQARVGDFKPYEGPLAKLRISVLWWELLARLGEELENSGACEVELKRLAATAAILKAAQAGLAQCGAFESAEAEAAPFIFEGLDVERL